jgi:MFS family permease
MTPVRRIVLRVFLPFAAAYFLSYVFRVANAVIAPDLIRELRLAPGDLGLLTSSYLIAFGLFQLPLGVLLDRYGPRRVEAILLVIAAVGALLFGRATSLAGLVLGRSMIGLGVSACLMAAFKAFVGHFPAQRLPLVNGLQLAAGGLGALAATAPLQLLLGVMGWRPVLGLLAGLTLLASLLVWRMVPEQGRAGYGTDWRGQWQGVRQVFTSRCFRRLAPLVTASQASFMALQGLWTGLWLRDVAGLAPEAAAALLLVMAAGMTAGYLVLGALTERLGRLGTRPGTIAVAGMLAFMALQAVILVWPPDRGQWLLWMLFGVLGSSGVIAYAELSQRFPAELAGRVNTGLNLAVFAGAFAAQWGIGLIVGCFAALPDGRLPVHAYRAAFGTMLALQLLALAWFGILRPASGDGERVVS